MSKKDGKVSRRETLKLASAVSALGVGLGVTLEAGDAEAAPAQISAAGVGQLTIKLYKLGVGKEGSRDGGVQLLQAFELGALSHKGAKEIAGQYAIKMYNVKNEKTELLTEHPIELSTAMIKQ